MNINLIHSAAGAKRLITCALLSEGFCKSYLLHDSSRVSIAGAIDGVFCAVWCTHTTCNHH